MDPLAPRLNVVGVFNSCLEVFRFVQKGRKFGEEYEERLAKFEAAKHRLLSWGDRVAITQDTLLQPNFEYDVEPVFSALRQLEQLFRKVQKCLEKYEIQVHASEEELALASAHADRQSSQPFGSLLSNGIFEEWSKSRKDQAQQREKQTKIIQKAKFVLDAETLDNLFGTIEYFLEFLDSEERHRSVISVDHASHDGQWRYPSYGGQVCSPPEDLSTDDALCRRISAPAGAVSQLALRSGSISTQSASSGRQSHFRDNFNWRVSSASDASSFSEPSRTLSEPPPFEDTCKVWREPEFDEKREQTDHSPMRRQLSNLELSAQQCTTAEIASADTSISAFTGPPSLDRARRHNSFPMFNQQKNSTWAPSLASISSGTVEVFSSHSLNPNLGRRKCLASALDRSQLAILTSFDTSFEVCLFDTSQSPLPGQQLEALGRHPLERGTWTGVAIAGSYLAAWGEKVVGFKTAHRNVLASD
jgi:Prion-inhibition and propagation